MARKLVAKMQAVDVGARPENMNSAQETAYVRYCEKTAAHDAQWKVFDAAGIAVDKAKTDSKREAAWEVFKREEAKLVRLWDSLMSAYNGFVYAMTHTMLVPRNEVESIVGAALRDRLALMGLDGRSLGPLISDLTLALANSGVVIEEHSFDEISMCNDCLGDDDGA